jgi:SHAQKYF class myb-like DNA-binding protein
MTDILHSARPPGAAEPQTYVAEPEIEAEDPDAGDCEGAGAAEDGSETAGPAERGGGRRKGLPWTEAEHRDFLLGLQKLGKGDWRGISRHYVVTRTPTQVASHAQKHFIRQQTLSKRKRRHSLFDITGEEEAQPDAHGASDPQAAPGSVQPQPQQQAQQQAQAQAGQAPQFLPQFAGAAMPGGMAGFGYGGPMQAAAAAAQGWNPAAGFMGQQYPNYFQFAQQQAAAGAMFLAQQQQQQQQVAMAAFMQQHGFGAQPGFAPQGFGGQGFGFGAPGMVHMLPHYQQAMFSQPSVNASMVSNSTAHAGAAAGADVGQGTCTEAPAAADDAEWQPSRQLPSQQDLQQQQAQPLQPGSVAFASGQLASGMGSNAGSMLGAGSVHGSNHGSMHGSRHGSMPEGDAHGSGSGNGGNGSGDGSGADAAPAVGKRQQEQEDGAAPESNQEAVEVPPEGEGVQAKAHTPFADAHEQHAEQQQPQPQQQQQQLAAGNFGHGRLYRPTASHAKPSHSLSALPLFAPEEAVEAGGDAAAGGTSPADCGAVLTNPPAAAAGVGQAPHNAPHGGFMRPLPHVAADAKVWQDAQDCGDGGSGSGNSTANGGRACGSGNGSGNASSQNKGSQRSSGTGLVAAGGSPVPGPQSGADNAASVPGSILDGSKQLSATPRPPKRMRLGSPPPASAFEATPELAAAAQQRRG